VCAAGLELVPIAARALVSSTKTAPSSGLLCSSTPLHSAQSTSNERTSRGTSQRRPSGGGDVVRQMCASCRGEKATHVVVKTTIADKAVRTSTIVDMRPSDRPCEAPLLQRTLATWRARHRPPIELQARPGKRRHAIHFDARDKIPYRTCGCRLEPCKPGLDIGQLPQSRGELWRGFGICVWSFGALVGPIVTNRTPVHFGIRGALRTHSLGSGSGSGK
jgi:hypothetical protein